ncbi:major facilitator superfamily MFS_1 [Sphingobium chlorophenolicum L-1]|uniref:Major facilitator superfamily MFS_1 n=1 Tax=Sphingobium chlorophenolicum L-1 TaxID=690566 RepID=F6EYD5_SPHCR|nr:MFS transporter [Sphingobium chlorophenolicum]AEG48300.1 major facilitator superfamily MFS_1 [Sphingobium chlorophenolicum L-1]
MSAPNRIDSHAPARLGGAWWMVAVLFGLYVLSWIDRLIVSMLVTPIKAHLLLSDVQISMITSTSFAIFYAIFGLPLGWAADRFSRRWIIFGGVVVWGLATTACGFAQSYEALLIGRIFVGIGEAALLPAAYSLIADAFPPHLLTRATSTFQTAGKVGSATAFALGGVTIAFAAAHSGIHIPFHGPAQPWQLVMMMVGVPGILLALLLFTFPDPGRRRTPGASADGEQKGLIKAFVHQNWKLLTLMLVGTSALAMCGYSMTNWVPAYIERHFGWKPVQYGFALSLMNIVSAVSLVVNGWIVDRLFAGGMKDAHLRFYGWLILGFLPVIAYMFFATNPYVFLACYCMAQFITVPFMVYVSSVMGLIAPATIRSRMLASFLFVFTILGQGAGPAIVAALTQYVFRDEGALGRSLAVVVTASSILALLSFRMALRYLAPAIASRKDV